MLRAFRAILLLMLWADLSLFVQGADSPSASELTVLEKAAAAGDLKAQFQLGNRYYQGDGVSPNHDVALGWFRKAAAAGSPEAQLKLGVLAEMGIGQRQDLDAALDWYERAAKGSNAVAQFKAGMLYLTQTASSNQLHQATNWIGQSAVQGYGPAQSALADQYERINPPMPDNRPGLSHFWNQAVRGVPMAQAILSSTYAKTDPAESYKWLWLASKTSSRARDDLQNAESKYSAETIAEGKRRAESFVIDPIVAEGERLHRAAAEQGVADAQYKLALLCLRDDDQSLTESCKWLILAAEQEHASAASMLRHIDKLPMLWFFQERFRKGFTAEQKMAGTNLARVFKAKEPPLPLRESEQIRCLFPAGKIPGSPSFSRLQTEAEAGDANAQFQLGLFYLHEPLNIPARIHAFDESGNIVAPISRPRVEYAMEWLEKAARQGNPDAQLNLALIYLNRPAREQNIGEAHRWLGLAAEKRAEAQYQLARLLEQHEATASLADQFKYYRLAADQGHLLARERLAVLQSRSSASSPATAMPVAPDLRRENGLKLGIIVSGAALIPAADIMTISLSKVPGVAVLERAQLDKVFSEQALARNQNTDLLKAGRLLSADGLVLLEMLPPPLTNAFMLRLIAVRPGVIISEHRHRFVPEELNQWGQIATRQLTQPLAKLGIPATNAIPISILNLRSALVSADSLEKESQLTWLLTRRLVQQPHLFVLERKRLEKLNEESALSGEAGTFWNGAYTLEGVIDRDQVTPGITTVDIRLASPKTAAKDFRVSGPTDQLPGLVEQLLTNIVSAVSAQIEQPGALKPLEEAANYYDEAKWALRWRLYPEAQQASEASWALGLRRPELTMLRLRSYVDPGTFDRDEAYALVRVRRGLDLALESLRSVQAMPNPERPLVDLSRELLGQASRYLVHCSKNPEKDIASPEDLLQIRKDVRVLVDMFGRIPGLWNWESGECLPRLTLAYAPYWEENSEDTKKRLETLIDRGGFHLAIEDSQNWNHSQRLQLFRNREGEKTENQEKFAQWIVELSRHSLTYRVEAGLYHLLKTTTSDYELEDRVLELLTYLKNNQEAVIEQRFSQTLWKMAREQVQSRSYNSPVMKRLQKEEVAEGEKLIAELLQEQKARTSRRLQEEKVRTLRLRLQEDVRDKPIPWSGITSLFPYPDFTKEQAEMLEPLLTQFEKQLRSPAMVGSLRRKINATLNPPADSPRPAPRYSPPPQPAAGDYPYQTNLVTSIPGLQLLPLPINRMRQQTNIVYHGTDQQYAWFEITRRPGNTREPSSAELLQVNLETLNKVSVPFPAGSLPDKWNMPLPERSFLLHDGKVHLLLANRMWRLSDDLEKWTDTGFSLPASGAKLFSIGSQIVALTGAGILQIDLEGKTSVVLASPRRRPAVNLVDQVESLERASIFAGPDGDLCVQLGSLLYTYGWKTKNWTQKTGWPDLGMFAVEAEPGTVVYLNKSAFAVLGWTPDEPAPVFWLDNYPRESPMFSIMPPMGTASPKARWLIPNELGKLYLGFGNSISAPASVHRDRNQLWVVIAGQKNYQMSLGATAQAKVNPPYLMIASEPGMEPLVCPLRLTAPTNFNGSAEELMGAISQSRFVTVLTPRRLVLLGLDIPAIWSIPRTEFDIYLATQAKQPKLGRNQQWLRLKNEEASWHKNFDQNRDGKLDEMELRRVMVDHRYQLNQMELKRMEESDPETK